MAIDLNQEAIDLNNPVELEKFAKMLANLQGNILKSHGRNHAVSLFLEFSAEKRKQVKKWISDFTERYATSALRQYYEAKELKNNNIPGHLFACFYLSAEGYAALGFDDLTAFDEADIDVLKEEIPAIRFKTGMKNPKCAAKLKDPTPDKWEENYQKNIHALVLLADDNEERLKDVVARLEASTLEESMNGAVKIIFQEKGRVLREPAEPGKRGNPKEHFGFRDGISQPLFYKEDIEKELPPGAASPVKWNPSAPLKLALVKDPLADSEDCFGSYLVFRKLEQNVKKFVEKEAELAAALNLPENEKERAGALIVGRFKNGIPVSLFKASNQAEPVNFNNFNYKHEDSGQSNRTHDKCPYHAHIRKTNPRGDFSQLAEGIGEKELEKRIVRRGINYDHRSPSEIEATGDEPDKNVGILFMCFQSRIPNQFGFIQSAWVTDPGFPIIFEPNPVGGAITNRVIGLDPILEGNSAAANIKEQKWCPVWGDTQGEVSFHFNDVVTFKGGEFFFAPSLFFLNNLGKPPVE
jgi:Dyp-type peroxidase family